MHHRWENLLFLHWRYPPEEIQSTLPPGLSVDTFDGDAYLAITPFFMAKVRPVSLPALPWLSFFQELNVRTYVYDNEGVPGVWFYSLDCNRLAAVIAARQITALKYFYAEMNAQRAEWIDYSCRRRGSRERGHYRYRALGAASESEPGSFEFFVLERYYLFAFRRETRNLMRGQVSHLPYRFRNAEIERFSTVPAQLDGFERLTGEPDHVCAVDGLDVNIFAQEKVTDSQRVIQPATRKKQPIAPKTRLTIQNSCRLVRAEIAATAIAI
jgi:uncharacterized protein YqjF (DUF2071 family)